VFLECLVDYSHATVRIHILIHMNITPGMFEEYFIPSLVITLPFTKKKY